MLDVWSIAMNYFGYKSSTMLQMGETLQSALPSTQPVNGKERSVLEWKRKKLSVSKKGDKKQEDKENPRDCRKTQAVEVETFCKRFTVC